MAQFQFQRDEHVRIWVRRTVIVEAEDEDEAMAKASEKHPDETTDVEYTGVAEPLWDTEEVFAAQVATMEDDVNDASVIKYE